MKIIYTCIFWLLTGVILAQDSAYVCHQESISLIPLVNLNTRSIEFSPVYYQSGIVYVLAKEDKRFFDPKTGRAYFDLMYADLGPGGDATKSINFSPNIRTQYHEGPCTFNREGTELFFTRSNLSGNVGVNDDKGQVQLKIYHALKGNEDWEQITQLPFCSDAYSVAHPTLSPDGHFLVFTSDMPGGYGGMDLYIVERKNERWTDPVNLGAVINTKGNEAFPFWHKDGYLFFSSEGHEGKGGLDLFVSQWDTSGIFTGLQHLDSPFNSSRDDLGLIVSDDGTSGYMASDRKPTKGKDDLYQWNAPASIFCKLPATVQPELAYKELSIRNEKDVAIEKSFIWMIPMGNEGPSLYKEHFSTELIRKEDKEGAFYLRWGMTDTLSTQTANAISDQQGMVRLEANPGATYILVVQHDGYLPYTEVLQAENIPSIIRLRKSPAVSPACLDTRFTVFSEKGDQVLTNTKIQLSGSCLKSQVLLSTNVDGTVSACLPKACSIKAEILHEGYAQHSFTFTPTDENEHWKIYLKKSDGQTTPPAPIASGTVIVLDNIYYDFNKSVIRKGDAGELTALANVLKQYPDLTIELTSHTDTRGSAEYNMELSWKRSESSKSYLVLLGIDASRIITKAAGESSPRNKCLDGVPCTEAEHQYNRRTEVRITNPAQGMQIRYKGRL